MPAPPAARGGGRGRGPGRGGPPALSNKQKAAPIARPSHEYERSLAQRAYGDDSAKEAREAERQREAEERQRAREAGLKADLGSSAKYWEKVAEVGSLAGRPRPPPSSSSAPSWPSAPASGGGAAASRGGGGKGQAAQQQQQASWGSSSGCWAAQQSSWSTGSAAAWDQWSQWEPAGAGQQGGAEPWRGAAVAAASSDWKGTAAVGWGEQGQPDSGGAAGSRWPAGGDTGGARDFGQEEKARRAAARQAEAEERRRARGVDGESGWAYQQAAPVAVPWEEEGAGAGAAAAGHPVDWGGGAAEAPPRAGPPPSLSLAGRGLDDDAAVTALSQQVAALVRAHGASAGPLWSPVLDISGNRITDAGLKRLLGVVRYSKVRCSRLAVCDNALSDPHALVELLLDQTCGLVQGADLELSLTASGLSNEVFWRMCEACCKGRPRPPLRLRLGGGTWEDFAPVVHMAEKRGLQVARGQQASDSQAVDMVLL